MSVQNNRNFFIFLLRLVYIYFLCRVVSRGFLLYIWDIWDTILFDQIQVIGDNLGSFREKFVSLNIRIDRSKF